MAVIAQQQGAGERDAGAAARGLGQPLWRRWWLVLPVVGVALFLILVVGGYMLGWQWTGFHDNTLWDWLQLLILPVVIAVGSVWFNIRQNQTTLHVTAQQRESDLQIADNQQQEAALDTYLDRMAELLLDRKLRESQPGSGVREMAQARTVSAVWRVGKYRKGVLLKFLYETQLIQCDAPVIVLADVDLGQAHLCGADLHGANLSGANLSEADLRGADLRGASLRRANLTGARLAGANLADADLTDAVLTGTTMEAGEHGSEAAAAMPKATSQVAGAAQRRTP